MALTKLQCDHAVCPVGKVRLRLADEHGLYLEVTAAGSKYWRMKYRFGDKEKRIAFGVYPEVTLAEARERVDQARRVLRDGHHPLELRRDRKQKLVAEMADTFEVVARAWFEHWSGARAERHAGYVMRRLSSMCSPQSAGSRCASSRPPTWSRPCWPSRKGEPWTLPSAAGTPPGRYCTTPWSMATSAAIRWRGLKPSDALRPTRKENFARVDAREMPELLRKIEGYPGTSTTRLAMKLLALTFVRTGELIRARWDEFDFDAAEWRIPAPVMKMRTPHIVPLAPQTIEVLQALQTISGGKELLFPGERDHERPMSNNTILGALERMGYAGRMTGHRHPRDLR